MGIEGSVDTRLILSLSFALWTLLFFFLEAGLSVRHAEWADILEASLINSEMLCL